MTIGATGSYSPTAGPTPHIGATIAFPLLTSSHGGNLNDWYIDLNNGNLYQMTGPATWTLMGTLP